MTIPLVILGGGGVAREIHDIIEAINLQAQNLGHYKEIDFLGFIAEDFENSGLLLERGPILGGDEVLINLPEGTKYVVGIGDGQIRSKVSAKANAAGLLPHTLIHPEAQIGRYSNQIGPGSIICFGVSITTNVRIGSHVFLDRTSTIGHDVLIHDFVSVYPHVSISGDVEIQTLSTIGTGARIIQGLKVGQESFVGAGAVLTKNVEAGKIVIGVPARELVRK